MKNNEENDSINFSRRILIHLLSIVSPYKITLGLFWSENELISYQKDLILLKNTLLSINKNIQRIQHNPIKPISQAGKVKYPGLC